MMNDIEKKKLMDNFNDMWSRLSSREGADKVLDYLKNHSDYFTAPASTNYHNNFEGGLLAHSVDVAKKLEKLSLDNVIMWEAPETIYIIGLLHDICKTRFYVPFKRNVKNEFGQWEEVTSYKINDLSPIGVHGDKSVMMLQQLGLKLTPEEVYCIRYHMGAYEGQSVIQTLGNAKKKCPNIIWACLADELATLDEDMAALNSKKQ